MFRSLFLAAALMAFTPLAANAGEITLLPSIKLQIGDRDHYGNYWDGGHWRDRDYWHRNYEWRKNRWWRHDNGYHRGWDKRKAYERGYREGWRDRDDHRGKGRTAIKHIRQWSTMPDATLVRLIRPTNRIFNA